MSRLEWIVSAYRFLALAGFLFFFPILSQRPTVTSQCKYQFVYCYFLFPGVRKYTVDSRFIEDT